MDPKVLEAARWMMESEDSEKRIAGAEYVFERAGDDWLDVKLRAARILKNKAPHKQLRETAEWFLRKYGKEQ